MLQEHLPWVREVHELTAHKARHPVGKLIKAILTGRQQLQLGREEGLEMGVGGMTGDVRP